MEDLHGVDAARSELDRLRQMNNELSARLETMEKRFGSRPTEGAVERRQALRVLGGVIAAGTGAAVGLTSLPAGAHAAVGNPLKEGTNTPTVPYVVGASVSGTMLQLANSGNGGALQASSSGISPSVQLSVGPGGQPALKVDAQGALDVVVVDGPTRLADVRAGALTADTIANVAQYLVDTGVRGSGLSVGVQGSGVATGVSGSGLVGLKGIGGGLAHGSGIGLEASGPFANARFPLQGIAPWSRDNAVYEGGEMIVDQGGTWWVCVKPGLTADSWRAIASPGSAGSFVPVNPARIYDSRQADGPLAAGTERSITMPSTLPDGITAVHVNVTVANTVGQGYLALFPGGTTWPGTSTVNWFGSGQAAANAITVRIGGRALMCRAGDNRADVVIDLYGYYR